MRIAVIGPQNTGKSTFIKDFLLAFPTYVTPTETYRDIVREKGLTINRETTEESQRAIRDFLFTQTREFPGTDVIFDRCVIDNYVYTKAQHEKGLLRHEFVVETEQVMRDSLSGIEVIFLIPTAAGVAFVDDELRDTDRGFADHANTLFIDTLLRLRSDIPHRIITVSGPREMRIERARRALAAH
jgi:nicotinamide riboside kinase